MDQLTLFRRFIGILNEFNSSKPDHMIGIKLYGTHTLNIVIVGRNKSVLTFANQIRDKCEENGISNAVIIKEYLDNDESEDLDSGTWIGLRYTKEGVVIEAI